MSQSKTIHIIGAGFEQVPAIHLAKEMGLRVVVTDMNSQAPGAALADVFGQVSTNDKNGNLLFAQENQVDGIMTLGSELAVPVVAYVAAQLGLPSFSEYTALCATNKNVMRKEFEKFSVPAPASKKIATLAELEQFVDTHDFPLVIKPSDSSGQRGVELLKNGENLQLALDEAIKFSTDGYAIVEQYVTGPEINVTAVVQDGKVHFLSLSHRVTAEPPHFGIAVEHRAPVDLSDEMVESVKDASRKAIEAIGLMNGIAYPQVIAGPKGAQVLEIAARIPGGHMREVALILSGVDMVEVSIRQAIGEPLPFSNYIKQIASQALVVKFFTELDLPGNTEILSEVSGFDKVMDIPGVFLSRCLLGIGDAVPKLESSTARFAAVIVRGESEEEVNSILNAIMNTVVLK